MSIGGVSGQRKLSIWGRMLEGYRRHQDGEGMSACPENRLGSHPYMQTHLPDHLWFDPSFFEKFVRRWTAQKE
jgi:hypothetical protein